MPTGSISGLCFDEALATLWVATVDGRIRSYPVVPSPSMQVHTHALNPPFPFPLLTSLCPQLLPNLPQLVLTRSLDCWPPRYHSVRAFAPRSSYLTH